jgi:hypothetical protein
MILLHIFIYTSWALGLLAALVALSMKLQEHSVKIKAMSLEIESDTLDVAGKKNLFDKIVSRTSGGIPEEIRRLMSGSPDHPEVDEIDDDDDIVGISFKASQYPPGLDDSFDDDDEDPQGGIRTD